MDTEAWCQLLPKIDTGGVDNGSGFATIRDFSHGAPSGATGVGGLTSFNVWPLIEAVSRQPSAELESVTGTQARNPGLEFAKGTDNSDLGVGFDGGACARAGD